MREKSANLPAMQIDPLYPVLVSCEFERFDEEVEDDTETENFFGGTLTIGSVVDNIRVATCDFNAGERLKREGEPDDAIDQITFEVKASYLIAIRPNGASVPNEEVKRIFTKLAEVSAWTLFRTLFSQMVAQSNRALPPLPVTPELMATIAEPD